MRIAQAMIILSAVVISVTGMAESRASGVGDSSWSRSDHEASLRFRSEAVGTAYLDQVAGLSELERLVLLSYDRCGGLLERPPKRLSSAYRSCKSQTLIRAESAGLSFDEAQSLMEWRDNFASGNPVEFGNGKLE